MTRTEAKAAGLTRYFTGKPCPQGHIAERHVSSGSCVVCLHERSPNRDRTSDKYKAANQIRQQRYRDRRHDEIAQRHKLWRDNNPDKPYLNNQWRIDNPEKAKAAQRRRYSHLKAAVRLANRRAEYRGDENRITFDDVRNIHFDQEGKCAICSVDLNDDWILDHKVAFIFRGKNNPENIQLLCPDCDKKKTASENRKRATLARLKSLRQ